MCNKPKPAKATTPHKHASTIKAWADGAKIQYWDGVMWDDAPSPTWALVNKYRVKPEPKPDVVVTKWIATNGKEVFAFSRNPMDELLWTLSGKIQITINGETGKLRSADVLSQRLGEM